MSNKTLVTLATVLGAILLLIGGLSVAEKQGWSLKHQVDMGVDWQQMGQNLHQVEIATSNEPVILERQGTQWTVNGFEADPDKTTQLIEGLKQLEVSALVSQNPDKHSQYDMAAEQGLEVKLIAGTEAVKLILGGRAVGSGFYLRLDSSDTVYLVKGIDRSLFENSLDDWRNKQLVKLTAEEIDKIIIDGTKGVIEVYKNDEAKWMLRWAGQDKMLGEVMAGRFLGALNPLEGNGFVSDQDSRDFSSQANTRVEITKQDGQPVIIKLLEQEEEWWGQVESEDQVYRLDKVAMMDLMVDVEGLFQ